MADYYFCNGTTQKNQPCQNHVEQEGGKCRFHGSGGGPTEIVETAYNSGKKVLDVICYFHAAAQATPFALELAKSTLGFFSKIAGTDVLMPEYVREAYLKNKDSVCLKLAEGTESEFQAYFGMCNHLISHNVSVTDLENSSGEMQRGA